MTPGRYYVQAMPDTSVGAFSLFGNQVMEPGFVRTFYPGTTDASAAVSVELEPGAELRTIDFILSRQKMLRVRGRVFDPQIGKAPDQVSIEITPRNQDITAFAVHNEGRHPANGAFEFENVPRGSYWVMKRSARP